MKFSTIFSGLAAAATAVTAAPASVAENTSPNPVSARAVFDASRLNGLQFKQQDLRYLQGLNALDLQLFQTLQINNNLDVLFFEDVFNVQVLDVNALLKMQTLQTLLIIGQSGIFNAFDLGGLQLKNLDLGLINGLAGVDLNQFIDDANRQQIQIVADNGRGGWRT